MLQEKEAEAVQKAMHAHAAAASAEARLEEAWAHCRQRDKAATQRLHEVNPETRDINGASRTFANSCDFLSRTPSYTWPSNTKCGTRGIRFEYAPRPRCLHFAAAVGASVLASIDLKSIVAQLERELEQTRAELSIAIIASPPRKDAGTSPLHRTVVHQEVQADLYRMERRVSSSKESGTDGTLASPRCREMTNEVRKERRTTEEASMAFTEVRSPREEVTRPTSARFKGPKGQDSLEVGREQCKQNDASEGHRRKSDERWPETSKDTGHCIQEREAQPHDEPCIVLPTIRQQPQPSSAQKDTRETFSAKQIADLTALRRENQRLLRQIAELKAHQGKVLQLTRRNNGVVGLGLNMYRGGNRRRE